MSNPNACARAGQDRANLYNEITDKIIAELEAGRVPWAFSPSSLPLLPAEEECSLGGGGPCHRPRGPGADTPGCN